MPQTSHKRRLRPWSLQARFDVSTFVHVLRCGLLFVSAISTAATDPCCQSLAAAQARFGKSPAGLRHDAATASFAVRGERERERLILNFRSVPDGGAQGRRSRIGGGHGRRQRRSSPAEAGTGCDPGRPARRRRRRDQFWERGGDRMRLGVPLYVSPRFRTDLSTRAQSFPSGALPILRLADVPAMAGALFSCILARSCAAQCDGRIALDPTQPIEHEALIAEAEAPELLRRTGWI